MTKAQRLEQGSNIGWRLTRLSCAVTVVLPATEDREAEGVLCTEDGRMLSARLNEKSRTDVNAGRSTDQRESNRHLAD